MPGPRPTIERPGDHPSHRVLAAHHLTRGRAHVIELRLGQHIDVGGDLQHRVRRGVQDELAARQVMLAEGIQHGGPAERPVAAEPQVKESRTKNYW